MLKSYVLKQNKELSLRNIITHYFWFSNDIEEGIIKNIDYKNNLQGLENDINREQIKEYMKGYYISLKNKNNFNKFIDTLKGYYPNKINSKDLLKEEGLNQYFNSLDDLYKFIINNIIPIAEQI